MKIKNIKYAAVALMLGMGMTSCSDFLDRPVEDNYNTENFYDGDDACISGVNYLYNSPWYDFQRGFIKIGEVMSGNMYWGSSPYLNFSTNGTDEDLINMSYSLWAVIGHSSTVYESLQSAKNCSDATRSQCMGECLAWKAMAYFYLVRTFGDVPIIHSNSETLANGDYNTLSKVQKSDVYDYIVLTLEKAIELLPATKSTSGRIDKYCAEGLLSKVYLAKAGVSGTLNKDDLSKAAEYAKDVIENSGRELMENYADIFRGKNRFCDEIMIAWRWTVGSHWTSQNTLQSDLAPVGFDENGDCWGGYVGPSVDLMDAFGVSVTDNPSTRLDKDTRRKATIMMAGDTYDYFWRDRTMDNGSKGFNYLQFLYDKDYNSSSTGELQSSTGGNNVKHLFGDNADHQEELGMSAGRMANALPTPILRLADVYLIYAEAEVLLGNPTEPLARDCYNKVHGRGVKWADPDKTTLTFDDIWKERRLELAGEGDRWYDFVRRSYYDMDSCIKELKSQRRNAMFNVNDAYKTYYESGYATWDASKIQYDTNTAVPNVTSASFTLPFPTEDVTLNPNLGSNAQPIHVDVRSTYSY
jgi:starch-binding outer membrane protein, SusD/RagB family